MVKFEITASAVAWYAAIVATGSAMVSAYNILRDRARLQVTVKADMKLAPSDTSYGDATYVVVTAVNTGRRPITVTKVWFEKNKHAKPKLLLADSMKHGAKELSEGKWADYLGKQDQFDPSLKYVCVEDSTGRVHRRRLSGKLREELMPHAEDSENRAGMKGDGQ